MHSTNRAFDRYFQFESDGVRDIYADAAQQKQDKPDQPMTMQHTPFFHQRPRME
jgi:hypothetical protein